MATAPHSGPGADPLDDMAVGTPVRCRYVIASVPRSGSSLLAWTLWATGVAGGPNEYLNPLQRRLFERRWGVMPLEEYVASLEQHRTSANGVFGLKLHHHHRLRWVNRLGRDITLLMPGARYIAITRRDRVAQAVSLEIAHQTGRWSSVQRRPAQPPTYDSAAISRRLRDIDDAERGWEWFFERHRITPLRLTLEDVASELSTSVDRVLDWLGVASDPGVVPPAPPLAQQGDAVNNSWIDRFRHGR